MFSLSLFSQIFTVETISDNNCKQTKNKTKTNTLFPFLSYSATESNKRS